MTRRQILRLAAGVLGLLSAPQVAFADPIITPIVIAITTSLPFVSAAVDTFVFFTLQAAFYAGTAFVAQKLFGPKQPNAGDRQASVMNLTVGEGPREVIFGRSATGGQLLDAFNFGGTNGTDWEVLVIKVADHKCDAFEGFFINDTFYSYTGDGLRADFSNQLEIYWKDGDASQTALSFLLSRSATRLNGTPWTSADVCAGMAYVVFAYKADDPKASNPIWPQGRPSFKPVIRGKRCYDPRKDSTVAGGSGSHRWATPSTWEWTENAAICDYNFDRGIYAKDLVTDPTQLLIGRGLSDVEAPADRVAARANVCDEAVSLKAGGTEPRYRVGGVIGSDRAFIDVKEDFAAPWPA